MQKKNRKIWIVILKFVIAFLSFFYIYTELSKYKNIEFSSILNSEIDYFLLAFALFLMPVNWILESVKWKYLLKNIESVKITTSFKAVLSGISFAVFTPNRIGELVGRIFVLKRENRTKGIFATAAGSLSQLMTTLIIGISALVFFEFPDKIPFSLTTLKIISVFFLITGLLLFFNLSIFERILQKFNIPIKFIESLSVLSSYKRSELIKVLLISILRYFVFLSQFYLLLLFFKVEISMLNAILSISLTYLISSVIPSFTLTEIGVRGSAAIFFIGMFTENTAGILAATASLWVINLAIPAVIGAVLFIRTKI